MFFYVESCDDGAFTASLMASCERYFFHTSYGKAAYLCFAALLR